MDVLISSILLAILALNFEPFGGAKEIWNDGKKFWAMIRELKGKDREREEEACVYDDEGTKTKIMIIQKDFTTR